MMKMTRISIRLTDALLIVLLVYAMWRYGPLVEKIADAVENDEHLAEIKAILRNGFENITLSHGRSPVCREWAEARHILSEVALSSYYSFTIEEFATDL